MPFRVRLFFIGTLIQGIASCGNQSDTSHFDPAFEDTLVVADEEQTALNRFEIKMEQQGGVYMLPVKINGFEMNLIFDTGASDISISTVEAAFLSRQGKINSEDIIRTQKYRDANGEISEGIIIRLKEVTIGSKTIYNTEACIVPSSKAPLLLGISALRRFGNVSFNPSTGVLVIEYGEPIGLDEAY